MRLVSYLNVSNLSNLEADSGFVFQRALLGELARRGWDCSLIGATDMPEPGDGVRALRVPFPDSKYGVRFTLDWEAVRRALGSLPAPADVILVNQSELTVALGTLAAEVWRRPVPCVTYFHYLAINGWDSATDSPTFDPSLDLAGAAPRIWARQVESARFSCLNLVGSDWGRRLFVRAAAQDDDLASHFVVLPPPCDLAPPGRQSDGSHPPLLLYNHRLYGHYGGREVFGWLAECRRNTGIPFEVVVTDPTAGRSAHRDDLDGSVRDVKSEIARHPFVRIEHAKTRAEYARLVAHCDVAIAPLRRGALWSMALADAMWLGKPALAPSDGAFPEIVGDPDLLFSSREECLTKLHRLLGDADHRARKGVEAESRARSWSVSTIGGRFVSALSARRLRYA